MQRNGWPESRPQYLVVEHNGTGNGLPGNPQVSLTAEEDDRKRESIS